MERIFDHDDFTGVTSYWIYDESTDTATIKTVQDVQPLIELNKADFNEAPKGWGEGRRVASIPIAVFTDLQQKGITKDEKAFKRWLNDPENRFFRTRPGII